MDMIASMAHPAPTSLSGTSRALVFQNTPIRTHNDGHETWFCAADICAALGYARFDSNLAARVSDDWRGAKPIRTLGGVQHLICFTESGLNEFLMRCDKPAAEPFRRWLAGEVLPSIRRNGGYIAGQENLSPAELMARAVLMANQIIAEKDAVIAAAQPAIEFTQAVCDSADTLTIGAFAQMIGTGQNRLFARLRELSILQRDNRPYQRYIDAGFFRVKETIYTKPDETHGISTQTLITGRGQVWLNRKLGESRNL